MEWRTRLADPAESPGPWEPMGVIPVLQETHGQAHTTGSTFTYSSGVNSSGTTKLKTQAVLLRACSRYGTVQEVADALAAYDAEVRTRESKEARAERELLDDLFRKWVGRDVRLSLSDGTMRFGRLRSVGDAHLVLLVDGHSEEILKTDVLSGEAR